MKYQFVCPKCKNVSSCESESPFDNEGCQACDARMAYLGYTTEEWNLLGEQDKLAQAKSVLEDERTPRTMYLKRLSKDMHTVKNILMFYLIASIFVVIIIIFLNWL